MSTLKGRVAKAYQANYNQWLRNDNDSRRQHEVNVDFSVSCIGVELGALKIVIDHTNHLLSVLLVDPLVQKDQKAYIVTRMEANKRAPRREYDAQRPKAQRLPVRR